jgi:predicted phosphodiesterase
MKIRLISDTHYEFGFRPETTIYRGESALVIAGDFHKGSYATMLYLRDYFDNYPVPIIYLPGNHEYYGESIRSFDASLKLFNMPNFHYLNPGTVKIKDVTFIAATGWTNFRKDRIAQMACASRINDFRAIQGWNTDLCSLKHTEHFKYIMDAYALVEGKKVIVTHFLPAVECIDAEYQGPDLINYYFANDYGDYISNLKDTTWLFGHTHSYVDLMIGDTRMVARPYGYTNRNDYDNNLIIV